MSKINKISVDGAVYDIEDASVPGWAKGVDKPTYKTSELENDSSYVTEAQMNERISNIEISGGVDLTNYATKEYVDEQISNIEASGGSGSDYELPIASSETLGGIKVGANLTINENGVLSANNLIFEYEVEEPITQIQIEGLDLLNDGCIYDVYYEGNTTGSMCYMCYRINGRTDYIFGTKKTINNSAKAFVSELDNNINYGFLGVGFPVSNAVGFSHAVLSLCEKQQTNTYALYSIVDCYISEPSNLYTLASYAYSSATPIKNLTSLTLYNQNGNFVAGSKIRIYKRG